MIGHGPPVEQPRTMPQEQNADERATHPAAAISSVSEVAEEAGSIIFTVRLSQPAAQDTTVEFEATGSAEMESDYDPVIGSIIVPAGQQDATFAVALRDDDVPELPETLTLSLLPTDQVQVNGNAASTTVVITDGDQVALLVASASRDVTEDGKTRTGALRLSLAEKPPCPVKVRINVEDETEVHVDRREATFTPGNWDKQQVVTILGVEDGEADGNQQSQITFTMEGTAITTDAPLPAIDIVTLDGDGAARLPTSPQHQFLSATSQFMTNRLNVVTSSPAPHSPHGNNSNAAGTNMLQVTGETGTLEGNFAVSSQGVISALAPRWLGVLPTADLPLAGSAATDWNVWADGQFGFYRDKDAATPNKGDFFVGFLGLDYRISENTALGIMGEFDWMESREQGSINEIAGHGFLAGPYISSEITSNIFFDARALWGLSDNDATQDVAGTVFIGDFQTECILLEAKLAGQHDIESLRITPEVAVLYTSDDQSAYTISGGGGTVLVPGQTVDLGRVSAGLALTHLGQLGDYSFEPFVGGKLNWDFKNPDAASHDLKATISAGFTLKSDDLGFGVQATWDGVGSGGYEGISGKLTFSHAF